MPGPTAMGGTAKQGAPDRVRRSLPLYRAISFIAILLLLFLAINAREIYRFFIPAPTLHPDRAVYTLAILPVQSEHLDTQWRWIRSGGQLLMQQALEAENSVKLVAQENVNGALDLFQIGGENARYAEVGRLLGADYLLHSEVTEHTQRDQFQLKVILINAYDGLQRTVLEDALVARSELSRTFQGVPHLIRDVLRIDDTHTTPTPLWSIDAELYTKAQHALNLGELESARDHLNALLESEPEYAPGWLMKARVAYLTGNIEAALHCLKSAIQHSAENTVTSLQARALDALWRGESQAAEAYLRRLIAAFPHLAAPRLDLAALLMERGDFQSSGAELERLVASHPQSPTAWLELAKSTIVAGNIQRAVDEYLVKALGLFQRLNNRSGEGDTLNAMGVAYQRLGQWQEAEKYYLRGYQLRYEEGDIRGQVVSLSNLATIQGIRGNLDAGLDTLEKAKMLAKTMEDPAAYSEIFNQVGLMWEEQGRYEEALVNYRKALAIRMRMEDRWLQAESQNNVGFIYYLLADFDHAMIYWRQAAENFALTSDTLGEVQVKLNVAQLYLQRGSWSEALQALQMAEQMAKQAGLKEEVIIAQAYQGRLAFLQGSFQSADKYWSLASDYVSNRGDYRGAIEFGLWRAELALVLGKQERAANQLAELENLLREHGSPDQWVSEKLLRFRLAMDKENVSAAHDIYRDIEITLSTQVPQNFHLRAKTAALELGWKLSEDTESVASEGSDLVTETSTDPWQEYPVEKLRWLEVIALNQWKTQDWTALENTLDAAQGVMEEVDGYWKGYLFHHLKFVLSLEYGRGDIESRELANRAYSGLLNNIDPADRYAFQARNALPDDLAQN
ncbi:tetratricopeptide repeat protein [Microbulbifer sp.]|uniref:tetratricopeptide repeat protein n=1 Tax=Microbulbifer sp. TaxID=1908541 RepID=UPI00258D0DA3|nr:tetratricopeptide repeat protein [Microbulbifer sp.]